MRSYWDIFERLEALRVARTKLEMLGQLASMIEDEERAGRPLFDHGFNEFKRFACKVLEVDQ